MPPIFMVASWWLAYEYELVRYAIPVPVRGRGRAPAGACRCRSIGGAPGGRTPERMPVSGLNVVVGNECWSGAVAGGCACGCGREDACGFESVRAR